MRLLIQFFTFIAFLSCTKKDTASNPIPDHIPSNQYLGTYSERQYLGGERFHIKTIVELNEEKTKVFERRCINSTCSTEKFDSEGKTIFNEMISNGELSMKEIRTYDNYGNLNEINRIERNNNLDTFITDFVYSYRKPPYDYSCQIIYQNDTIGKIDSHRKSDTIFVVEIGIPANLFVLMNEEVKKVTKEKLIILNTEDKKIYEKETLTVVEGDPNYDLVKVKNYDNKSRLLSEKTYTRRNAKYGTEHRWVYEDDMPVTRYKNDHPDLIITYKKLY